MGLGGEDVVGCAVESACHSLRPPIPTLSFLPRPPPLFSALLCSSLLFSALLRSSPTLSDHFPHRAIHSAMFCHHIPLETLGGAARSLFMVVRGPFDLYTTSGEV